MPIIAIRIVANAGSTQAQTNLRTQPGDVVWVAKDDHQFSAAEKNCGHYRFITITGCATKDLANLVTSLMDANGVMTKRRTFRLSPSVLSNATWANVKTATKAQLDLIVVAVP